jgi:hypothetical protein
MNVIAVPLLPAPASSPRGARTFQVILAGREALPPERGPDVQGHAPHQTSRPGVLHTPPLKSARVDSAVGLLLPPPPLVTSCLRLVYLDQ